MYVHMYRVTPSPNPGDDSCVARVLCWLGACELTFRKVPHTE